MKHWDKEKRNKKGNNIRTGALRAKFEESGIAMSVNLFRQGIVHASVVVLYIVSPIDSWINVRLRVYFVKVSLFVLQCICLCKDMIYYNICCDYQTVFFHRLFLSLLSLSLFETRNRRNCYSSTYESLVLLFTKIPSTKPCLIRTE